MKRLIILLILIALGKFGWDYLKANIDMGGQPAEITNPVYAEVRVIFTMENREFEGVLLAKTVDDPDCKAFTTESSLELALGSPDAVDGVTWRLKSAECTTTLSARNAKLFDNKPTFTDYISLARGRLVERDMRMIYWGLTAKESEFMCGFMITELQEHWKGPVSCIKAIGA